MKKSFKSVLTFALALAMMVTCMGGLAFAKSSDTGSIDGYTWTVRVSTTDDSATATTSFGANVSSLTAEVTVYYWLGLQYYSCYASGQVTPGYAVATATKKRGGAEVIGAKGEHHILYDGTNTFRETSIGETPSGAIDDTGK